MPVTTASARRRPLRALPLVLAASALLATGCGGSRGGESGLLEFARVRSGPVTVEPASDGRSAVIRLRTEPPTVCAVAYGESDALGRIANARGMAGAAITDHEVVLRDLTPGTTYRYRLTATDAAGRVYQTPRLGRFRTPRPAPRASLGANVARGARVVASSSEYGPGFEAANAFDGDPATEWSTAGDGDGAFVTVDLGREIAVGSVAFRTREMSDGSSVTRTFAVVVDGRRHGPFAAGDRSEERPARSGARGRRLRFEVVDSTGGNTGAAEIEVFAGG